MISKFENPDWLDLISSTSGLLQSFSIMSHHDTITGTSQKEVMWSDFTDILDNVEYSFTYEISELITQ